MPSRVYYQQQAKRLLEAAARMSARRDAEQLIARANEYQILADAMPDDDPTTTSTREQPKAVAQQVQQQQQKNTDEDKK